MICLLLGASCKKKKKISRIGIANIIPAKSFGFNGLKKGMETLGYHEGSNIEYFYPRTAKSLDDMQTIIQQLIDNNVDIIVTFGNYAGMTAYKMTKDTSLPVVLAVSNRPVEMGLAKSYIEPGGNVTGVHMTGFTIKTLDWLLRIKPDIKKIYVPFNPLDKSAQGMLMELQKGAEAKDVELIIKNAESEAEMENVISQIPEDADASMMLAIQLVLRFRKEFIRNTNEKKIPLASAQAGDEIYGAIISFGFELEQSGEQAAPFVDQIINGKDPGTIPFKSIDYIMGINMKKADELGITLPNEILNRADILIR